MISNRMKNKYTLKRKRHILRKKEHVGKNIWLISRETESFCQ